MRKIVINITQSIALNIFKVCIEAKNIKVMKSYEKSNFSFTAIKGIAKDIL